MSSYKVRKAVFPVAGLGSRFLPATKASPKEMLPVVDKPLIQYAVEEAVEAGVTDMVFITGRNKRPIVDHFDTAFELESELETKQKVELLELVQNIIPSHVSCVFIRRPKALGLGHAVLCAKPVVGNEPFAVILADDMVDNPDGGCLKQMVDQYEKTQGSILAVEEVPEEEVSAYGVVSVDDPSANPARMNHIVEKPAREDAPSNLAVIGRYILEPEIIEILENTGAGSGGEIQLTDAIETLAQQKDVYAYRCKGIRYDCGSKLGFLKANVEYALNHHELGDEFREYLKRLSCVKVPLD